MAQQDALRLTGVETQTVGTAEVTVLVGQVGDSTIMVGDGLILLDGAENEERVLVTGVMVDREGYRVTDVAEAGDAAKVILRRTDPTLDSITRVLCEQ